MVDNWKDAWKWLSTWGLSVIMAAPIAYENIDLLKDALPPNYFHGLVSVLAVITFALRLKKQS